MPNFKNISLRVPGRENIYKVRISSAMNEDGIYHALHSGLKSVVEAGEITITNPDRNDVKVYLHYSHLKYAAVQARIVVSAGERQDAEGAALCAGELGDTAEEALEEGEEGADAGWDYEEEGRFHIVMR
jgi:predicted RNase H-like HicB family nuclease